jgi:hypothetical protein
VAAASPEMIDLENYREQLGRAGRAREHARHHHRAVRDPKRIVFPEARARIYSRRARS